MAPRRVLRIVRIALFMSHTVPRCWALAADSCISCVIVPEVLWWVLLRESNAVASVPDSKDSIWDSSPDNTVTHRGRPSARPYALQAFQALAASWGAVSRVKTSVASSLWSRTLTWTWCISLAQLRCWLTGFQIYFPHINIMVCENPQHILTCKGWYH